MLHQKQPVKEVERKLCYMRCFEECLLALNKSSELPKAICYEPSKVTFKLILDQAHDIETNDLYLFEQPVDNLVDYQKRIEELKSLDNDENSCIRLNFEDTFYVHTNGFIEINNLGFWIKVSSIEVY